MHICTLPDTSALRDALPGLPDVGTIPADYFIDGGAAFLLVGERVFAVTKHARTARSFLVSAAALRQWAAAPGAVEIHDTPAIKPLAVEAPEAWRAPAIVPPALRQPGDVVLASLVRQSRHHYGKPCVRIRRGALEIQTDAETIFRVLPQHVERWTPGGCAASMDITPVTLPALVEVIGDSSCLFV